MSRVILLYFDFISYILFKMITLTIDNSYSRIQGLSAKQEKDLRISLSYTVGNYYSGFGIRKKSLLDKKGYFPTGLLSKIDLSTVNNIIDLRKRPKLQLENCINTIHTLYDDQHLAAYKAITYRRGTISMPTGTGKSIVIALIAARLNVPTLVVVPNLEIKKQLSNDLIRSLGPCHKVVVENIDSAVMQVVKDFDCLIIDEAHHVAAKTYQKLNKMIWNGIYYRFFLTATPFRNNSEENLLFESIAGEVIHTLSYKKAIKKNYIVPVEGYYIESPKQQTEAYTYAEVYKELVVKNAARNVLISKLLTQLHSSQKSTLCLVKEVEHGKILSDITGVPFINGEDDESRKYISQFNKGGLKVVIATTGMMGEGIDTKPCEYVLIAGLGKAKSHFMQQVGRAVRKWPNKESAKIILIRDKSHKFLIRHFNEQKKILLDEYGTAVLKLDL